MHSDHNPRIYSNLYICTRVWAWVTEYASIMLVNTLLCFSKRYLHIFNHPRLYPSTAILIIQTVSIYALPHTWHPCQDTYKVPNRGRQRSPDIYSYVYYYYGDTRIYIVCMVNHYTIPRLEIPHRYLI